MTVMDEVFEAVSLSYERLYPCSDKHAWTVLQLSALLDNILVDNPQLSNYYKAFADTLKLL